MFKINFNENTIKEVSLLLSIDEKKLKKKFINTVKNLTELEKMILLKRNFIDLKINKFNIKLNIKYGNIIIKYASSNEINIKNKENNKYEIIDICKKFYNSFYFNDIKNIRFFIYLEFNNNNYIIKINTFNNYEVNPFFDYYPSLYNKNKYIYDKIDFGFFEKDLYNENNNNILNIKNNTIINFFNNDLEEKGIFMNDVNDILNFDLKLLGLISY